MSDKMREALEAMVDYYGSASATNEALKLAREALAQPEQRGNPTLPGLPDGWGLAAFRHKWEGCETKCECKVCGTVFGAVPGPTVPPVSDDWKAHFSSVFWLLENDRSQWLVNDSGEFTDDVHKAWKFPDEAAANRARSSLTPRLSMTKPTEHMIADREGSEQCSHARTFNGRLCCDCGAEVDPATQNFGRYGTAPPAPSVVVPDALRESYGCNPSYINGWNACRAAMLAAAPEVKS